jgi:hypothetical protein
MKELTCNFAIARFRPYRETGEFVNVGVVLLCPQLGYFGYDFERRKYKRITDFFPELDFDIFKAGLAGMAKELSRLANTGTKTNDQLILGAEVQLRLAAFKELVRPREALFHFGEVGTVLAADPAAKLQELFGFYIKRQFARDREYQEIIMRRRLADFLQKENLARFYKQDQQIGDDTYHVILPFVHYADSVARKAIKPLHLDKDATTDIYRHGDAWIASIRRLRDLNRLPKEMLFAVKQPASNPKRQAAADQICTELKALDVHTVPFANTGAILEFARVC